MTLQQPKSRTALADLPPELWDHITSYLPSASSIASLGRTSRGLHAFVEKDAWKTFSRTRFPTLCPVDTPSSKETARSLTTLSRAWDRRALVARYVEVRGDITAFPTGKKVDKWKRPRGQTIGFTPQLDVYEQIGPTWRERNEFLASSAGAEVCLRQTRKHGGREDTKWTTYKPASAREGKDDVTSLHLLRHDSSLVSHSPSMITGTANGDLQLLRLPSGQSPKDDVGVTYFATQGRAVRTSSLWQDNNSITQLACSLGDARLALYPVDPGQAKICPSSEIVIQPSLRADGNPAPNHRIWSARFLSSNKLAAGIGPSDSPVHVYSITDAGISQRPLRTLRLREDTENVRQSSVYTTVPLTSSMGSPGSGDVFLSGAYDGVVRLHDLRSNRQVEQIYIDAADDSPIYSILPRGQETFLTGTSRHNLLKVFDLRLGAKQYSYLDAAPESNPRLVGGFQKDYNLFLRPSNNTFTARGGNWSQGRGRSAESSVYSLASPSTSSPYIYAGVENAIWSLAFTELLDPHPDPAHFDSWSARNPSKPGIGFRAFESKEVQDLAMYDQETSLKLSTQWSLWGTWRTHGPRRKEEFRRPLDERWKGANEFGR